MALGFRDSTAEDANLPADPFAHLVPTRERDPSDDLVGTCRGGAEHEVVRTRIAGDLVRTVCIRCGELHLDLRSDRTERWCAATTDEGVPCPQPALPTDTDRLCEAHAIARSRANGLFSRRVAADVFAVARAGSFAQRRNAATRSTAA